MEYERLTAKNADYEAFIERVAGMSYLEYVQKCINKEKVEMPCVILKYMLKMHERLADLEDKIEQGTLIELPCKVGDTVYWLFTTNIQQEIYECYITEFIYNSKGLDI
jgi:hypothetical protein